MKMELREISSKKGADTKRESILIVDDNENIRGLLKNVLMFEGYETASATNGKEALEMLATDQKPDLILMDIEMPVMDGYQTCKEIRDNKEYSSIPIIVLTAVYNKNVIKKVLTIGANDYIAKPFEPEELLARISSHIRIKGLMKERDWLYNQAMEYNIRLEQEVKERTWEIEDTQDATIIGFAKLAEYRDPETGLHLERIREYCKLVAGELMTNEKYKDLINKKYIDSIYKSSPLHDIGKVGIPDSILLKPGKLTPEEFEIMKQHSMIGGDAISEAEKRLRNKRLSFLAMGKVIAYYHHEKFDGTGYPQGLKGDKIPLSARIMALADVYDALISKRVYKEAWSHEATGEVITKDSGRHFDPDVVDAFLKLKDEFLKISKSEMRRP
ncbi:MAG: response regulator [Nitrospinota bacterium]